MMNTIPSRLFVFAFETGTLVMFHCSAHCDISATDAGSNASWRDADILARILYNGVSV